MFTLDTMVNVTTLLYRYTQQHVPHPQRRAFPSLTGEHPLFPSLCPLSSLLCISTYSHFTVSAKQPTVTPVEVLAAPFTAAPSETCRVCSTAASSSGLCHSLLKTNSPDSESQDPATKSCPLPSHLPTRTCLCF